MITNLLWGTSFTCAGGSNSRGDGAIREYGDSGLAAPSNRCH